MENGQGKRRPPPKRKENAADLRQMDLWTGGARPEPGTDAAVPHADKFSSISSQTDEIPKIDSKANRTRPAAAIQPHAVDADLVVQRLCLQPQGKHAN